MTSLLCLQLNKVKDNDSRIIELEKKVQTIEQNYRYVASFLDDFHFTPLSAAKKNHIIILRTLVEHGADFNGKDANGDTHRKTKPFFVH